MTAGSKYVLNGTFISALGTEAGKGNIVMQISGQQNQNLEPATSLPFLNVTGAVVWGTTSDNSPVVTAKGPGINSVSGNSAFVIFDATTKDSFTLINGTKINARYVSPGASLEPSASPFAPISFLSPVKASFRGLEQFTMAKCDVWTDDALLSEEGRGALRLHRGTVVLAARRDQQVIVGEHTVFIAKGTISQLSLSKHDGRFFVRNLTDKKAGAIRVTGGDYCVKIGPSQQLRIGTAASAVPYRNEEVLGRNVYLSEFSIPFLISNKGLVNEVTKQYPALRAKIIKTAAALAFLTTNRGPYKVDR